ncbi:hypothetical protein LCGC14_3158360, partial [marine sediment metagenome]
VWTQAEVFVAQINLEAIARVQVTSNTRVPLVLTFTSRP